MLVQWAESELSELSCRFTFEGVQSYLCGSELRCNPLSQVDDLGMRLSHFHTFVAVVDLNLKNFLPFPLSSAPYLLLPMIIHLEEHKSPSATQSLLGHLHGGHFAIDGTGILEYTGCECLGQYSLISSDDLFELA